MFRINFGFAWLRFGHIFGNRTGGEISMLFVFGIPIAAHASKGIRRDSECGTIVADTVQRHDRNLPTVMIRTRTATNSSLVRTKSSSPWALAAFRDMVDRVGGRPRVGRRIRSGVEKDPGTPTIARPHDHRTSERYQYGALSGGGGLVSSQRRAFGTRGDISAVRRRPEPPNLL